MKTGSYVSGFNLTNNRVSGGHGHHINQVRLNMITKDGISDIAVLGLICRPQRSLNLHLVMKRKGDTRFVDGELSARKSVMLSSLQTSSTSLDAEFAIRGRWQDIGGSDQAAAYFRLIDEDKAVAKSSLLQTCNSMAEKIKPNLLAPSIWSPSGTWIAPARSSMTALMTCATGRERSQLRWLESFLHPWVLTAFEEGLSGFHSVKQFETF